MMTVRHLALLALCVVYTAAQCTMPSGMDGDYKKAGDAKAVPFVIAGTIIEHPMWKKECVKKDGERFIFKMQRVTPREDGYICFKLSRNGNDIEATVLTAKSAEGMNMIKVPSGNAVPSTQNVCNDQTGMKSTWQRLSPKCSLPSKLRGAFSYVPNPTKKKYFTAEGFMTESMSAKCDMQEGGEYIFRVRGYAPARDALMCVKFQNLEQGKETFRITSLTAKNPQANNMRVVLIEQNSQTNREIACNGRNAPQTWDYQKKTPTCRMPMELRGYWSDEHWSMLKKITETGMSGHECYLQDGDHYILRIPNYVGQKDGLSCVKIERMDANKYKFTESTAWGKLTDHPKMILAEKDQAVTKADVCTEVAPPGWSMLTSHTIVRVNKSRPMCYIPTELQGSWIDTNDNGIYSKGIFTSHMPYNLWCEQSNGQHIIKRMKYVKHGWDAVVCEKYVRISATEYKVFVVTPPDAQGMNVQWVNADTPANKDTVCTQTEYKMYQMRKADGTDCMLPSKLVGTVWDQKGKQHTITNTQMESKMWGKSTTWTCTEQFGNHYIMKLSNVNGTNKDLYGCKVIHKFTNTSFGIQMHTRMNYRLNMYPMISVPTQKSVNRHAVCMERYPIDKFVLLRRIENPKCSFPEDFYGEFHVYKDKNDTAVVTKDKIKLSMSAWKCELKDGNKYVFRIPKFLPTKDALMCLEMKRHSINKYEAMSVTKPNKDFWNWGLVTVPLQSTASTGIACNLEKANKDMIKTFVRINPMTEKCVLPPTLRGTFYDPNGTPTMLTPFDMYLPSFKYGFKHAKCVHAKHGVYTFRIKHHSKNKDAIMCALFTLKKPMPLTYYIIKLADPKTGMIFQEVDKNAPITDSMCIKSPFEMKHAHVNYYMKKHSKCWVPQDLQGEWADAKGQFIKRFTSTTMETEMGSFHCELSHKDHYVFRMVNYAGSHDAAICMGVARAKDGKQYNFTMATNPKKMAKGHHVVLVKHGKAAHIDDVCSTTGLPGMMQKVVTADRRDMMKGCMFPVDINGHWTLEGGMSARYMTTAIKYGGIHLALCDKMYGDAYILRMKSAMPGMDGLSCKKFRKVSDKEYITDVYTTLNADTMKSMVLVASNTEADPKKVCNSPTVVKSYKMHKAEGKCMMPPGLAGDFYDQWGKIHRITGTQFEMNGKTFHCEKQFGHKYIYRVKDVIPGKDALICKSIKGHGTNKYEISVLTAKAKDGKPHVMVWSGGMANLAAVCSKKSHNASFVIIRKSGVPDSPVTCPQDLTGSFKYSFTNGKGPRRMCGHKSGMSIRGTRVHFDYSKCPYHMGKSKSGKLECYRVVEGQNNMKYLMLRNTDTNMPNDMKKYVCMAYKSDGLMTRATMRIGGCGAMQTHDWVDGETSAKLQIVYTPDSKCTGGSTALGPLGMLIACLAVIVQALL